MVRGPGIENLLLQLTVDSGHLKKSKLITELLLKGFINFETFLTEYIWENEG